MANRTSPRTQNDIPADDPLTARVRLRVEHAGRLVNRPAPGARSRKSKLKNTSMGMSTAGPQADSAALLERRSLMHVYRELRSTYRRHRRVTGQAAVPALKTVVVGFQRGPSLPNLVSVAAFLDERGLLAW
jgi:hypothetical protein